MYIGDRQYAAVNHSINDGRNDLVCLTSFGDMRTLGWRLQSRLAVLMDSVGDHFRIDQIMSCGD